MRILLALLAALAVAGCSEQPERTDVGIDPGFPVAEGQYQLTENWHVTLPGKFNRSMKDGSLVIWRPGFTIWSNVWNNDQDQTPEEILAQIQASSSPKAFDTKIQRESELIRYSYRLDEKAKDDRQPALYCFAISSPGYVQMAVYFDDASELAVAEKIGSSLEPTRR